MLKRYQASGDDRYIQHLVGAFSIWNHTLPPLTLERVGGSGIKKG